MNDPNAGRYFQSLAKKAAPQIPARILLNITANFFTFTSI